MVPTGYLRYQRRAGVACYRTNFSRQSENQSLKLVANFPRCDFHSLNKTISILNQVKTSKKGNAAIEGFKRSA